jgi:hypothetical protein
VTSTSDATLLGALTEELSRLFDVALAVEPAGCVNDAWAKVLEANAVAPVDDATRNARRASLNLARGALPEEVAAVARAIAARFAHAVGDHRLVEAATETWQQIEGRYLEHATWRPKSMFAFAVASAKAKTRASWNRPPGGFVARCSDCGGPRLSVEGDLTCAFCGTGTLKTI